MKKLIILFIFTFFISICNISYAQINKRIDSFNESVRIFSFNDVNSIDSLRFRKIIQKNGLNSYDLLLSTRTHGKDNMYSKQDANIKINDDILNSKILNVTFMHYEYSKDVIDSNAELKQDQIDKLKTANKVSLRFYHENGLTNTIDVPDSILAEWKQVIEMEK